MSVFRVHERVPVPLRQLYSTTRQAKMDISLSFLSFFQTLLFLVFVAGANAHTHSSYRLPQNAFSGFWWPLGEAHIGLLVGRETLDSAHTRGRGGPGAVRVRKARHDSISVLALIHRYRWRALAAHDTAIHEVRSSSLRGGSVGGEAPHLAMVPPGRGSDEYRWGKATALNRRPLASAQPPLADVQHAHLGMGGSCSSLPTCSRCARFSRPGRTRQRVAPAPKLVGRGWFTSFRGDARLVGCPLSSCCGQGSSCCCCCC